jgi:hypothetical protein
MIMKPGLEGNGWYVVSMMNLMINLISAIMIWKARLLSGPNKWMKITI